MTKLAIRSIALILLAQNAFPQMTYHARITTDQGVPPANTPQIIPDPISGCSIGQMFGNGEVEWITPVRSRSDSCPVTIRMPGYRKNKTTLRSGAVIVMRRPGSYANPTVSLTTLAAPEDAKKAFQKGVGAQAAGKLEAARKEFERAVAAYPEYTPAWGALGEVLVDLHEPAPARHAFEEAVKADSKFAPAWAALATLAAREGRHEDALDAAARALQLDATGFPAVYVAQAEADLAFKRLDAAEKSARRAVDLDTFHEIPRAERVLASILAAEGDRAAAVEHWKKYLDRAPKAGDADEVRRLIAAPAP